MAIPKFEDFLYPFLEQLKDKDITTKENYRSYLPISMVAFSYNLNVTDDYKDENWKRGRH